MLNNVIALLNGGGAGGGGSSFESIATAIGTGSSGTITFSSIPSTYTHLQLRWIGRTADANTTTTLNLTFNNSAANYYAIHYLRGDGSTVTASKIAGTTYIYASIAEVTGSTAAANIVGSGIIDIHDYASSTKNKTLRAISGVDQNGSGGISLSSGLWMDTSAINRIDLTSNGGNWTTQTVFALYGIKG